MRDPYATHELGLADVARRDPLDDLLNLLIFFQHRDLPAVAPITGESPREDRQGRRANLIRVLEATLKRPRRGPRHPAHLRPPTIKLIRRQRATHRTFSALKARPNRTHLLT